MRQRDMKFSEARVPVLMSLPHYPMGNNRQARFAFEEEDLFHFCWKYS